MSKRGRRKARAEARNQAMVANASNPPQPEPAPKQHPKPQPENKVVQRTPEQIRRDSYLELSCEAHNAARLIERTIEIDKTLNELGYPTGTKLGLGTAKLAQAERARALFDNVSLTIDEMLNMEEVERALERKQEQNAG